MISIEGSIFRGLLYDQEYSRTVYPYLKEEFFDGAQKILFNIYKELFDKYNTVPNLEAIAVTLQKQDIGDSEFEAVVEFVETISDNKDLPDVSWLINETEEYCKDKAIYNAIYASIGILDGSDKNLDKNIIPELLDDALAISFDSKIGMDYFDDAEKRYDEMVSEESIIKMPLDVLNFLMNGGLRLKTLAAFMAGPNVGKSSMMCFLAGELMKAGHNVLYITMEMSESLVGERIDANLINVTTDELKKMKKSDFVSRVQKVKSKNIGRLVVKEYPTSGAHVGHFRHLIKEINQKKKFKPVVVFIDYINICASSRYRSMNGVNSYSYIKAIAEELRGLAVETETAFVTATQINRGGMNEQSPDMTATSESFGLPATLDWFAAITTDEVLQDNNQQLLHLLKTRWGNKSKIKPQLVGIDFDKMRYTDVGSINEVVNKVGQNKPNFTPKQEEAQEGIVWD